MRFITIGTSIAILLTSQALALPAVSQRDPSNLAVANIIAVNKPLSNGPEAKATETPLQIPIAKLTTFDLSITSLELQGITVDVPNVSVPKDTQIVCQRYKDEYGLQPGSAMFATTEPALISTNPVDFGWVICIIKADE